MSDVGAVERLDAQVAARRAATADLLIEDAPELAEEVRKVAGGEQGHGSSRS
jgi:hypothetical protein